MMEEIYGRGKKCFVKNIFYMYKWLLVITFKTNINEWRFNELFYTSYSY